MRSPIIGVYFSDDNKKIKDFVRASTYMTHTDPRAEWGSLAVAVAAAESAGNTPADGDRYLERLGPLIGGAGAYEFMEAVSEAVKSAEGGTSTEEYAEEISPGGVTGFVMHTVPVALHAWLSHPGDFEGAVKSAVRAGGDTDTTAAIVGGIVGAATGKEGIPNKWLDEFFRPTHTEHLLPRRRTHARL
jgi:ADP-ribosylglycohydrolase